MLLFGESFCKQPLFGGFPKIRGTFFGVPQNKDYSILGSILGLPFLGNNHLSYAAIVSIWADTA